MKCVIMFKYSDCKWLILTGVYFFFIQARNKNTIQYNTIKVQYTVYIYIYTWAWAWAWVSIIQMSMWQSFYFKVADVWDTAVFNFDFNTSSKHMISYIHTSHLNRTNWCSKFINGRPLEKVSTYLNKQTSINGINAETIKYDSYVIYNCSNISICLKYLFYFESIYIYAFAYSVCSYTRVKKLTLSLLFPQSS